MTGYPGIDPSDDRRRAGDPSSERAALSAFVAVVAVFFVMIAITVGEGSRRLSNISRAQDLASEAARAAAATLDPEAMAFGEPLIQSVGPDSAEAQADMVLAASGDTIDSVVAVAADQLSVRVDVIVRGRSVIPGFDVDGFGSHTATVIEAESLTP